jgi:hypothetical protein
MEKISSMTGKELLQELKTYNPYKNQTDYYIKKSIGGTKLATVDQLKQELTKLSTQTTQFVHQSPTKVIKQYTKMLSDVPQDIKMNFLLQLSYPDLINACQTNKQYYSLCQDNYLWNKLIERDFPFYPSDKLYAKKSYEHWYNYFDKTTLKIISDFIIYRKYYNNLQITYEQIFNLLVNYIIENNNMMAKEIQKEADAYDDEFNFRILNQIFNALGIPMESDMSFVKIVPSLKIKNNAKSLWAHLKLIINDMMTSYQDPIHEETINIQKGVGDTLEITGVSIEHKNKLKNLFSKYGPIETIGTKGDKIIIRYKDSRDAMDVLKDKNLFIKNLTLSLK